MDFFKRTKHIDIDLGNLTMKEIMNFPEKGKASLEGFYINEVFNPNHIQIAIVQSRSYTSGIHDFKYDTKTKEIKIFSRYRNSAFLIYGYLLMPLLPLLLGQSSENTLTLVGITVVLFVFLSLILIIGIKSEAKEIEREMVLRVNYIRRHKI